MNSEAEVKDLFSRQSAGYSRFRPTYPPKLFEYLASLVEGHALAWDVGTGNGQAAVAVAEHFDQVVATDFSQKQISNAQPHSKVEYRVCSAEKSPFPPASIDLVTVAQAFHWFNQDLFFTEVRRVLKPGGVLAFWSYGLARITPEVDSIILKLYRDILGSYWEPNRKLVEEGYQNVSLPSYFEEITPPKFEISAEWSLEHLIGYLDTWSAFQTFTQKNQTNPLDPLFPELRAKWGPVKTRTVHWDLAMRVGRVAK